MKDLARSVFAAAFHDALKGQSMPYNTETLGHAFDTAFLASMAVERIDPEATSYPELAKLMLRERDHIDTTNLERDEFLDRLGGLREQMQELEDLIFELETSHTAGLSVPDDAPLSSGELPLDLQVGPVSARCWLSREMWESLGRRAGFLDDE